MSLPVGGKAAGFGRQNVRLVDHALAGGLCCCQPEPQPRFRVPLLDGQVKINQHTQREYRQGTKRKTKRNTKDRQ